jgi:hypothetical protein
MNRVKAPKILSDIVSDLRDRHLLLPAIALVVALVAIPVLLSSESEPVPPPPAAGLAASGDAATQLESAVISDTSGVRNYRKRLKLARSQNPFKQQFATPTKASVSIQDSTTDAPSGGGGSSVDAGEVSADSASATESSVTEATTTDETTLNEQTTNETNTTIDEQQVKPQTRFYAGRVDVAIGKLGDVKEIDDVRYLDFLPSDREPVVSFISLDGAGKSAVFALSRDIVSTSGDGTCTPKEVDGCEMLTLKVGDERLLKYADGTTFRLKLLETRLVRVPDPRPSTSGD